VYALTFRLADSAPAQLWRDLRLEEVEWRERHPEPWSDGIGKEYRRRFTGRVERWLDMNYGECVLRTPGCAAIVAQSLRFFEGTRTRLHAWVVMPNHVHVLAQILEGHTLPRTMASWKGFTAREINRHLGRGGTLWQKGYHDRLIRDWRHFGHAVRYIRQNPRKAQLHEGHWMAGESDLARCF
jgi:REP element-mobilizing transposase RayT